MSASGEPGMSSRSTARFIAACKVFEIRDVNTVQVDAFLQEQRRVKGPAPMSLRGHAGLTRRRESHRSAPPARGCQQDLGLVEERCRCQVG